MTSGRYSSSGSLGQGVPPSMATAMAEDQPVDAWLEGMRDPAIALARRRRVIVYVGRLVLLAIVIVLWQVVAPHEDHLAFASPSASVSALGHWAGSGTLWSNLWVTVEEVVFGYLIGLGAGVILGLALSLNDTAARIADPFLIALYGVPKIAFAPLLVLWFGIGLEPKLLLTATLVFFVVFFTTYHGVRTIDKDLVQSIRLLGASSGQVRRVVIFPAALRTIVLGMKLGVPEALVGAIIGEFIVSSKGIGYLVDFSASQLDASGVFAGLIVLTVLAIVLNGLVSGADKLGGAFSGSKNQS